MLTPTDRSLVLYPESLAHAVQLYFKSEATIKVCASRVIFRCVLIVLRYVSSEEIVFYNIPSRPLRRVTYEPSPILAFCECKKAFQKCQNAFRKYKKAFCNVQPNSGNAKTHFGNAKTHFGNAKRDLKKTFWKCKNTFQRCRKEFWKCNQSIWKCKTAF